MKNVALIFQPHFKTNCFRVAIDKQLGDNYNYVIVTCCPTYNGVYKYPRKNAKDYEVWKNKSIECYCVPIKDCVMVQELTDIKNESLIKEIRRQQKKWLSINEYVKGKPEWML